MTRFRKALVVVATIMTMTAPADAEPPPIDPVVVVPGLTVTADLVGVPCWLVGAYDSVLSNRPYHATALVFSSYTLLSPAVASTSP